MLINILIRTSYRPKAFKRALESILNQTHPEIRIIVSYDDDRALEYIPDSIDKIRVYRGFGKFFYDEYCNTLKNLVIDGYFMFLDDDDFLSEPTILSELPLNEEYGLIVQLTRGKLLYPINLKFVSGGIGMPCLVLHHTHKNIAHITAPSRGDYYWIKDVEKLLPFKFFQKVVVISPERGDGKMELPNKY